MSEINYRVILVGDPGAGKTSFFRKLSSGIFDENIVCSLGNSHKALNLNIDIDKNGKKENKTFEINLNDTAGQERFRSITQMYYKRSDGILIIYDITQRYTFDHVKDWVNSIKENNYNRKYVIILIGNKSDLIEGEETEKRQVKEEESKEMCNNYDMIWGGEISIKTIDVNDLKEIFKGYVKKIYEKVGEKSDNAESKKINKINASQQNKKNFC